MTACFKLMKALQPNEQRPKALCESCVYFGRNLDSTYSSSHGLSRHLCGLDFTPGDEKCNEMRTNNCSARKR